MDKDTPEKARLQKEKENRHAGEAGNSATIHHRFRSGALAVLLAVSENERMKKLRNRGWGVSLPFLVVE
jgi:hypothetical protein